MLPLLDHLLRATPTSVPGEDVASFLGEAGRRFPEASPIAFAVSSGFIADRLGAAFAAGYQAAIRALFPRLPADPICSFSVTEAGGNHPRAIETRLLPKAEGGYVLSGKKRWATLSPVSSVLFVVASSGEETGRKRLRAVRVSRGDEGVRVLAMPETPFIPEVPHAVLELDGVVVKETDVLEGDGYERYVKPFRTVEDVHVHAATLGYLLGVARRNGFGEDVREQILASIVSVVALAALDPSAPATHIAVSGALSTSARTIAAFESGWSSPGDAEYERWHRDKSLLAIASGVREKRRVRAWELIEGDRRQ